MGLDLDWMNGRTGVIPFSRQSDWVDSDQRSWRYCLQMRSGMNGLVCDAKHLFV